MKNEDNQGQSRVVEDIAARLPPNARASFISSAQQLGASSLAVTRALSAVLAGCTWAIINREFPASPKTMVVEENTISERLVNMIPQRREAPPHDPRCLEFATRNKTAFDNEQRARIDRINSLEAKRTARGRIWGIALSIMSVLFLLAVGLGALATYQLAEQRGFEKGRNDFAVQLKIPAAAVATLLDDNAYKILTSTKMAATRTALVNIDVVNVLNTPGATKILQELTLPSLLSVTETLDGIKLIAQCRQMGVHLFLADPRDYPEILNGNDYCIGINKAIISRENIRQNESQSFTLIPFRRGKQQLPDLGTE